MISRNSRIACWVRYEQKAFDMTRFDLVLSATRSVGASFPIASSLVNAWNEYAGAAQVQKCEALIETLAKQLEGIQERADRTEKECADVFALGLRYAINDPDYAKANLYATLIASFCEGSVDRDAAMNLIYECETLLPYDLETLGRLRGGRVDSTFQFGESTDRAGVSKCQSSIKKLESKGLIGAGGEGQFPMEREYENPRAWPYTFFQEYYRVLPQGEALLEAITKAQAQQMGAG